MLKAAAGVLMMALLGAPTPADAPVQTGPGTRYFAGDPPARFVKEGLALVMFVAPSRMNEVCGMPNTNRMLLVACVRRLKKGGVPVIFMPHPVVFPGDTYAQILNHELAHAIGGWDGTHPL